MAKNIFVYNKTERDYQSPIDEMQINEDDEDDANIIS